MGDVSGMRKKAMISVIIPAYNIEKWIGRCIESVCGQTYRELEIIVVDDGSTDDTGKVIDSYAERDPRIKAIHKENGGLVETRETGIAIATGDYVGFVDGDDAVMPDMYERLLANALKYDADISHCGMCFCFSDGREELHYGTGTIRVSDNAEGQKMLLEGKTVEPSLCNKLYKREILADSCLDKSIVNNEDLLRNFVLFKRAYKSVFEDICGYRYIQRDGSMSNDRCRLAECYKHIMKARKIIVNNASEDIKPYAMASYFACVINFARSSYGDRDPESAKYGDMCREILKENRLEWHCMTFSQRLTAWLIVYVPWLYNVIFKAYSSTKG